MEKYYNNLIHEYLDGGLESEAEGTLFMALSGDEELRREFDKLLKISMVSSASYSFDPPPVETSARIFSQLGFSLPANPDSAPVKKLTGLALLAAFLWKSAPFAAVAILAGALSIGAFKYWGPESENANSLAGTDARSSAGAAISKEATASGSAFPEIASFEARPGMNNKSSIAVKRAGAVGKFYKTFATREEFEAFIRNNPISSQNGSTNDGDIAALSGNANALPVNRIEDSPELKRNSRYSLRPINFNELPNSLRSAPQSLGYAPNLRLGALGSRKLSVEFRKLTIDKSNLELLRNPNAFNNYSVAVNYKILDELGVGLVVARENFPQQFVAPSGNRQSQNPTLTTYAIESRFSTDYLNLAGIALPYASVAAGGSSMGPIGKLEAGIALAPSDLFELAFGWQSGYLFYNVNGTNYIADKSGFIWGVRVNF